MVSNDRDLFGIRRVDQITNALDTDKVRSYHPPPVPGIGFHHSLILSPHLLLVAVSRWRILPPRRGSTRAGDGEGRVRRSTRHRAYRRFA